MSWHLIDAPAVTVGGERHPGDYLAGPFETRAEAKAEAIRRANDQRKTPVVKRLIEGCYEYRGPTTREGNLFWGARWRIVDDRVLLWSGTKYPKWIMLSHRHQTLPVPLPVPEEVWWRHGDRDPWAQPA